MTLRQTIQGKIDAATAEIASLQEQLKTAETTFGDWIDQEADTLKAKAEALVAEVQKHL